jgi:dTDP-4-dehydrorhamnose 3,5-epimerase
MKTKKLDRKLEIPEVLLIEPDVFEDNRGFFFETYNKNRYSQSGVNVEFVQDNVSMSKQHVLRGLHYQLKFPQDKLVQVVHGRAFDVAVDIRRGSPTFGKWIGAKLTNDNHKQLFIPRGFAHGFYTLTSKVIFSYKCSEFYFPDDQKGINAFDRDLDIKWGSTIKMRPYMSESDSELPNLRDIKDEDLPVYEENR